MTDANKYYLDKREAEQEEYDFKDEYEEIAADNVRLEAEVTYWKADSAAAWDKCEENRLKLAKAVEALDEAVYLLAPNEKDMMRQAGVYRIVTTLAELRGEQDG